MDVPMNGCISGCHTYLIYFLGKGRREGAQFFPSVGDLLSPLRAKDFGGALFFLNHSFTGSFTHTFVRNLFHNSDIWIEKKWFIYIVKRQRIGEKKKKEETLLLIGP